MKNAFTISARVALRLLAVWIALRNAARRVKILTR